MKKTFSLLLVLLILGTVVPVGFLIWRNVSFPETSEQPSKQVTQLLEEGKAGEALKIIQQKRNQALVEKDDASETKWFKLETASAAQLRDIPRLLWLYAKQPNLVVESEEASILLSRCFLALERVDDFDSTRKSWQGHEIQKNLWLCLDADALIKQNQVEEAVQLLQSASFKGKKDTGRLLRLALLHINQPKKLNHYLEAAYNADPKNPDVRSFRGQILEKSKQADLAKVEYTAAILAEPQNPLLRSQLADFYLRRRNYPFALQTLTEAIQSKPLDFFWPQIAFWSKVTHPSSVDWKAHPCPDGDLKPAFTFIQRLPEGTFWDEEAFSSVRESPRLLAERQEFFWLRLLQLIQNGKEKETAQLLVENPFSSRSWHSELESALKIILQFRLNDMNPNAGDYQKSTLYPNTHQFLESIHQWSLSERNPSDELKKIAQGPYALPAVFLACGWLEAALQLVDLEADMSQSPEWFRYGVAQALRQNRGEQEALAFIEKQPLSSLFSLLKAEILITLNRQEEGLKILKLIARENSDIGFRASWILANAAAEKNNFSEAATIVHQHPILRKSIIGQELLARLALLQGKEDEARQIYQSIRKDSVEAKAFLARDAFVRKEWATARELTLELFNIMPDNIQLRANLQAINKAAGNSL